MCLLIFIFYFQGEENMFDKETHNKNNEISNTKSENNILDQNDQTIISDKNIKVSSKDNCTTNSTDVNVFHMNRRSLPDITSLDIKISETTKSNDKVGSLNNKKNKSTKIDNSSNNINSFNEIDFFQDMEPVITSTNKHNVSNIMVVPEVSLTNKSNSKFEINDQDLITNDVIKGWGDEDVDDVECWTVGDNENLEKTVNNYNNDT